MSDQMREIIRAGAAVTSPESNVAAGYGYAVMALEMQGYLARDPQTWRPALYHLTDAGRAERERLRKADLAAIGVYEV